eukprot:scaffold26962_cov114-Isochrysis_galbana.AAC.14
MYCSAVFPNKGVCVSHLGWTGLWNWGAAGGASSGYETLMGGENVVMGGGGGEVSGGGVNVNGGRWVRCGCGGRRWGDELELFCGGGGTSGCCCCSARSF